MEKIINIAKYISKKYFFEKKEFIDEMKLHKITFFIQKESFIRYEQPMFKENFEGWKFGPVCRNIRKNFQEIKTFQGEILLEEKNKEIVDFIFDNYKDMDSYKLSYLTHLEYSWIKSRIGIEDGENGNRVIDQKDIYTKKRD